LLAGSTIRLMHEIAGEERPPQGGFCTALLRLQSVLDWSLWVRQVDVALIGGDPLLIARRVCTLLQSQTHMNGFRIAIIHPGVFSGAPISALEDPDYRESMSLRVGPEVSDRDAPMSILRAEIKRAASLLNARGGGGVLAFEMVQGLFDTQRQETVLRLTRHEGEGRQMGTRISASPTEQVTKSARSGRSSDLYDRSEHLFQNGLAEMRRQFLGLLTEPPEGQRFADLIIAKRCELLSGFISPPSGGSQALTRDQIGKMTGDAYRLAGEAPRHVSQAVDFWRQDFARATKDTIS
jgi:hypothetical protein